MKVIKALVAGAAVLTCSLGNPVVAASPWDYFGTSNGMRFYGKLTSKNGPRVIWNGRTLDSNNQVQNSYLLGDCNTWTVDIQVDKRSKFLKPTGDVLPGTMLDSQLTKYCS